MAVASIQGERQAARVAVTVADAATVEQYARTCSIGVATCRWRGRHNYPIFSETRLRFDRVREDGLLERTSVCEDCGCAIHVQLWEPYTERVGRRREPRVRLLLAFVDYQRNEHGEEYRSPAGKIATKAFREARARVMVDDQTVVMINEALAVVRKNERRAKR